MKDKTKLKQTRTLGQSVHQCADTEEDDRTCSRLRGIDRIKPVACFCPMQMQKKKKLSQKFQKGTNFQ